MKPHSDQDDSEEDWSMRQEQLGSHPLSSLTPHSPCWEYIHSSHWLDTSNQKHTEDGKDDNGWPLCQ